MNILITGCAGFVGSNLADKLIENNKIIGIDNFDLVYPKEIKLENIANLTKNTDFLLYIGDIRNNFLLEKIFSENHIDAVVHLAAKTGVRTSFDSADEYKSVNIDGTKTILNAMAKYNVKKFVFSSSSSVYGNYDSQIFSEDLDNLEPISPYAQTKLACENIIKEYSKNYGINSVCLRFFTVYGKRQRPDLAIHKFTRAILNDEVVTIYGDGTTLRDYTDVEDIVDGIIAAINYNKTQYEIINLGSSSPIILNDMVQLIEKTIGKKAKITHLQPQAGDVDKTYASIAKANELLNYKPKITFENGLKRFIEEFTIGKKNYAKYN